MDIAIHDSWRPYLQSEFSKLYFKELLDFLKLEFNNYECFPPENEIFNAFNWCHFDDVRVVVLGQDPYHDKGQANGLCFSVKDSIKHPPSLVNIFKEIEHDLNKPYPESGDLTRWAKQGVLLLNTTLTVRAHKAGSHQKKGWEVFTDTVIKVLNDKKENLIFLLWGGHAKKKIKLIDGNKHKVLTSGHPSPLSANRGHWFGNKHFSETNDCLIKIGKQKIIW